MSRPIIIKDMLVTKGRVALVTYRWTRYTSFMIDRMIFCVYTKDRVSFLDKMCSYE